MADLAVFWDATGHLSQEGPTNLVADLGSRADRAPSTPLDPEVAEAHARRRPIRKR